LDYGPSPSLRRVSKRRAHMAFTPAGLDHVNIFVRNAERSYEWYTDLFGFHTQDIAYHPGTEKIRAVFLSCDKGHAHDIALFGLGEEAPLRRA
jgi:catechol 2,3-dioxygenase-like lactoylglutathione lyase family enzyme